MGDGEDLLDGLDIEIPDQEKGEQSAGGEDNAVFFGPYQLIQKVGEGGVARVMRARHIHPRYADTTFAVKILHEELSRDPNIVDLFRKEAFVLSMLKHPNIVRTLEAGVQDDDLFIAMEYIDGRDLDILLWRARKSQVEIPVPVILHIIGEVLKALAFAHQLRNSDDKPLNLVHRDINPANVFLSYDGRVKLGDFGVTALAAGKMEEKMALAGKAGYFAPEQLLGKESDQRVDLYAVGIMMFEMLCGEKLFKGNDTDETLRVNRKGKVPKPRKLNPNIPPEVEAILLKALERKPADRYASGTEMLQALKPFVPQAPAMPLAVAALIRKLFLQEHIQELQLREGLAGGPARGSGQLVGLYTADQKAQLAFNELLGSRGYRCLVIPGRKALAESVRTQQSLELILADVDAPDFDPQGVLRDLASGHGHIPVVAVCDTLDPESVQRADTIHAVDLLFKPFNIERVLTAVRAAITGWVNRNRENEDVFGGSNIKVLLISSDMELVPELTTGLAERAITIEVSPNTLEAMERIKHVSYHGVIFDAHPVTPEAETFAGRFRGRRGMGLLPIVYLMTPDDAKNFDQANEERTAIRERGTPATDIADTLASLRANTKLGRNFIRYPCQVPVELRVGGRVFSAVSVDLSRGGMMLRSEQMAPVGSAVSVSFKPQEGKDPIEANGRVVRVELPPDGGHAQVGVEFEKFASQSEHQLIVFLQSLDPDAERETTVILNKPPPPRS